MSEYKMDDKDYKRIRELISRALVYCRGCYMSVEQYEDILENIQSVLMPATYLNRKELESENKNN